MTGGMEEGGRRKWERRNGRKRRMGKEVCKKVGRKDGRNGRREEGEGRNRRKKVMGNGRREGGMKGGRN